MFKSLQERRNSKDTTTQKWQLETLESKNSIEPGKQICLLDMHRMAAGVTLRLIVAVANLALVPGAVVCQQKNHTTHTKAV